ncbi:hypothetical protein GCM10023063_42370 [Arthrobacter methylotrophus]
MLEPQLVRLGTAVHACQGAEDCVDDEVRPPEREKYQCWHRDAQCDPDCGEVIVACRWDRMKGAGMGHD